MIIQTSDVGMSSKRSYQQQSRQVVSFGAFRNALSGAAKEAVSAFPDSSEEKKKNSEGDTLEELIERLNAGRTSRKTGVGIDTGNVQRRITRSALSYLWDILFGGRIALQDCCTGAADMTASGFGGSSGSFSREAYYHEEETTEFQATGMVKTSDGREISFNMELSMSRSFTAYYSETFGAPQFTDPLVINLDCAAADVKDQKFFFDLDADGHEECISRLGPGSGFLALDKNGDGRINDGSELFGTRSGNGFADLANYDADGNGWIDEADEIFEKLMVWTKTSAGEDRLIALGKAGVGAIYLGSAETDFSLNRLETNETNARVRSTGFFFYENGGMGTLQQLDLAQ